MSKPEIKLINYLTDVEYSYFDEDPDNDPTRAGDGTYYQLPGDDSWNGPYYSEEDASEDARNTLVYAEIDAATAELQKDGYIRLDNPEDAEIRYAIQAKGRFFEIVSQDNIVEWRERNAYPAFTVLGTVEFDNGQETFGHFHRAVRTAAEGIAASLGFEASGVVPRQVYDENAVTAMLVHETVREMIAPETPAPQGLAAWVKSMGAMELRFQCLRMAEEIDDIYASFKEFELDGVAFDEEFVPAVLFHAYDFCDANENTPPKLDGGVEGAIAFVKRHYNIEAELPAGLRI